MKAGLRFFSAGKRLLKPKSVPTTISRPHYAALGLGDKDLNYIPVYKGSDELKLRAANKLARDALGICEDFIEEGITTNDIDTLVFKYITGHNAYPSPLNFMGFPKSIGASTNNGVCHGIPNDIPLKNGDIVKIDVSVFLNGFHGDNCRTFIVGEASENATKLVTTTKRALDKAISVVRPGAQFLEIGNAIASVIEPEYSSVQAFVGHGIGREFHEPPSILHYRNEYLKGIEMVPGMCFCIEPMVNEGSSAIRILSDEWSVVSADNSLSAQFEHCVFVTEDGCDVLTAY